MPLAQWTSGISTLPDGIDKMRHATRLKQSAHVKYAIFNCSQGAVEPHQASRSVVVRSEPR